MQILSFF